MMKTNRLWQVLFLLTFVLSGITEAVAQTYERGFTFYFSKWDFVIEDSEDGDYIVPDDKIFHWSYGEDVEKPALPYINYQILLPDNYKIKSFAMSTGMTEWMPNGTTLASNPVEVSTSAVEGKKGAYPAITYPSDIVCFSEEVMDGYRIANFGLNPFTYYADTKKLALSTFCSLHIVIEPVSIDEEVGHVGTMKDLVESLVYNPKDIDKGTENWRRIRTFIQATVASFDIAEWDWIEGQYTKDWNIRFASSEHLNETVQTGIVADSTFNGTTYQVVEIKKNGNITDSLLYRQEGKKVYRYSESDRKNVLLFDFSLNVGDDFTTPNGEVWTVDAMNETVLYGGRTENSFTLKGKEDGMVKDIWLENVGSLYTGILTYNDFENGSLPQLVYCRQSDDSPWLFEVDTKQFKIVYFRELGNKEDFFKTLTPEELTFINQTRQEEGFILMDNLLADYIGDTLHIYGKMWMNCYTYPLECRITDREILLEVNDIHYGEDADCFSDKYVDIKIPKIKAGTYTIKYVSMYAYNGKEQILELPPSSIGYLTSVERVESISSFGSAITCTSPTATRFEVYTMDAIKVGEADFANGEATVKVDKMPATYLYIVTYPDGRRESGKVAVKNEE